MPSKRAPIKKWWTSADERLTSDGDPNCAIGRRPEGLVAFGPCAHAGVADYLARAAHLEETAVIAFQRRADELRAHGAPDRLIAAAAQSRDEEIAHTRAMRALAFAHGVAPVPAVAASLPVRTLAEIAIENVTEGCVRETDGALVVVHQSRHAGDESFASVMSAIAPDEERHAALSWDVALWIEAQLTADERARVDEARSAACEALRAELRFEVDPLVRARVRLPASRDAVALFDALHGALWAA